METGKPAVKLDWSRLLGFDQATVQEEGRGTTAETRRLAKLGAKVGTKGATARPRAS
jgi:hypothetical protein